MSIAPLAPRHPAKYTDTLLPVLARCLHGYGRILDPFAGTGKLRIIRPDAILLEIEPEWASVRGAIIGNALRLPFADASFDAVCTSPTYANRLADHHEAKDGSRRNSYKHNLGHALHPANSGALQWGPAYQEFHIAAWKEVRRVLRPGGRFVLNISDHIRRGQVIQVTAWHESCLTALGYCRKEYLCVPTPRLRYGANGALRVEHESVLVFERTMYGTDQNPVF